MFSKTSYHYNFSFTFHIFSEYIAYRPPDVFSNIEGKAVVRVVWSIQFQLVPINGNQISFHLGGQFSIQIFIPASVCVNRFIEIYSDICLCKLFYINIFGHLFLLIFVLWWSVDKQRNKPSTDGCSTVVL